MNDSPYRWYTFGWGRDWLKLGPLSFCLWHSDDTRYYELHWLNRPLRTMQRRIW